MICCLCEIFRGVSFTVRTNDVAKDVDGGELCISKKVKGDKHHHPVLDHPRNSYREGTCVRDHQKYRHVQRKCAESIECHD